MVRSSNKPRTTTEEMYRRVVHEVPDQDTDPPIPALINLRRLDDLLITEETPGSLLLLMLFLLAFQPLNLMWDLT